MSRGTPMNFVWVHHIPAYHDFPTVTKISYKTIDDFRDLPSVTSYPNIFSHDLSNVVFHQDVVNFRKRAV